MSVVKKKKIVLPRVSLAFPMGRETHLRSWFAVFALVVDQLDSQHQHVPTGHGMADSSQQEILVTERLRAFSLSDRLGEHGGEHQVGTLYDDGKNEA